MDPREFEALVSQYDEQVQAVAPVILQYARGTPDEEEVKKHVEQLQAGAQTLRQYGQQYGKPDQAAQAARGAKFSVGVSRGHYFTEAHHQTRAQVLDRLAQLTPTELSRTVAGIQDTGVLHSLTFPPTDRRP